MLTYEFFLTKIGKLKLRLTNNRVPTEISLGLQMTQEELEDALSANPHGKFGTKRQYIMGVADAKVNQLSTNSKYYSIL